MKHTIKKLPHSQVEIEVEISGREFDGFINQAVLNAGRDFKMPGFRMGKVPRDIVEEKIGKQNLLIDAADLAVKENYRKVILENNIEVISQSDIDILKMPQPELFPAGSKIKEDSDNSFVFKAIIDVLPEINLPDYRKIAKKIERNKVLVSDEEIEDALKWLQKSRAKFTLKNGPAQKGDFIDIDYWSPQITKDEKKKDSFILGEGRFLAGFEDNLIGLKAEEEKEFSLPLPENHPLYGPEQKEIDFKIKVKSVQNTELPELNDDFAKNLGNFENLLSLKKNIRDGIYAEKEQAELQRVRAEMLERISKELKCEIPQVLVKREKEAALENLKASLTVSFEDYLKIIKKTEEELLVLLGKEAEEKIKKLLILREIAKKENIEVSDEEIKEEFDKALKHYSSVKKAKETLDPEKLKEYIKEVIRNEKIFKLLESLVK